MEESQLWSLIAKKLSGEASPAELALLEELLAKKEGAAIQSEVITKIWDQPLSAADNTGKAETWDLINDRIHREQETAATVVPFETALSPKHTKWIAAASVIGLITIAAFFYLGNQPKQLPLAQNEVITNNGSRSEMTLPDGTTVILNSGSRIVYDKDFGTSNRNLSMSGEAFFDVTHNAALPFIIKTKNGTIRVLGTAFNVRSYPDEHLFETSLLRGKVELVLTGSPGKTISLKPMQKISVDLRPAGAEKDETSSAPASYKISGFAKTVNDTFQLEEVSWIKHKYVFRGETFEMLARKIEKWYGVKVLFENDAPKEKIFTGVFDDLSLEEALKALLFSSGNGFEYAIINNQVIIKKQATINEVK